MLSCGLWVLNIDGLPVRNREADRVEFMMSHAQRDNASVFYSSNRTIQWRRNLMFSVCAKNVHNTAGVPIFNSTRTCYNYALLLLYSVQRSWYDDTNARRRRRQRTLFWHIVHRARTWSSEKIYRIRRGRWGAHVGKTICDSIQNVEVVSRRKDLLCHKSHVLCVRNNIILCEIKTIRGSSRREIICIADTAHTLTRAGANWQPD